MYGSEDRTGYGSHSEQQGGRAQILCTYTVLAADSIHPADSSKCPLASPWHLTESAPNDTNWRHPKEWRKPRLASHCLKSRGKRLWFVPFGEMALTDSEYGVNGLRCMYAARMFVNIVSL